MPDPGAAERQWHCQQLLVKFFHLLDAKRYGDVAALFDEDGEWSRPGAVLRGRLEVSAALQQRPAHRLTRHLVSNFLVLEDRGDRVDAMSHLTTYTFESATPPVVHGPLGIFAANLSFHIARDAIRIAKLELAPEFSFPKPPG